MKYLSFIIGLLLLATLFSFVLTQLNKDETKHEYGIAFPLEESESRLPPLSSVVQLESDVIKSLASSVKDSSEATTTTETVATSSPKTTDSGAENTSAEMAVKLPGEADISVLNVGGESADGVGGSIIIESSSSSADSSSNDTDSEGAKDGSKDSSEEGDGGQTGTNNPKLVFIERLMGMNFQRAPNGGFSSFLEMRGESDSNDEKANKTEGSSVNSEDNEGPKGDINSSELPWGNTIESLRSRWESRIRKFTFPFQNSYSVVLRASGMASDPRDASESKDSASTDSADSSADNSENPEKSIIKPVDVPDRSEGDQPKFFHFQSSGQLGGPQSMTEGSGNGPNSQTNQLLRMAALSMMSKLFTALRNQAVYSNPKMDSGPSVSRFAASGMDHHHTHHAMDNGHDLDLDDDDDENDIDSERGTGASEGLPVPFIIARPNRMASMDQGSFASPYGYGNDQASPVRTSVMFGRPAPSALSHQGPIMMTQRFFASPSANSQGMGPMSPLAAILAAASARQRRMESQREQPEPSNVQPQRLILLISHRGGRDEMAPSTAESTQQRLRMFGRDEQSNYAPQPMYQYAPLSPPSSPIYYHFSPQASASSPSSSLSAQDGLSQLMGRPSIQLIQSMPSPQREASSQPQVVEVPVPVYLPMMMGRQGRSSTSFSAVGPAPVHSRRMVMGLPRQMMMMPAEPRGPSTIELPMSGDSRGSGHVALLMVQHTGADHQGGESHSESLVMPQHAEPNAPMSFSPSSFSASDEPASGFVRIFLRPKMSSASAPISAAGGRIAFHRRLDDSNEDDMPSAHHQLITSPLIAAAAHQAAAEAAAAAASSHQPQMLDNARLRQWRDYSTFVRSAPAPMALPLSSSSGSSHGAPVAHLLIATSAPAAQSRADQEASESAGSGEDQVHQYQQQVPSGLHFGPVPHQQQQPQQSPAMSPFFFQPHPHHHHHQPQYQQHQQVEAESGSNQQQQQQLPHPLMMAAAAAQQQQQPNQAASAPGAAPHAAFFILAEPNERSAQSEAINPNDA